MYCKRPVTEEQLTYLQWLRLYDDKGKAYKEHNDTLVGVKTNSPFKDVYFFQDLVMNYPYRKVDDLLHNEHDTMPEQIRHFAVAMDFKSELWKDENAIREHFSIAGYKNDYVETLLSFTRSKRASVHLWKRRVLGGVDNIIEQVLTTETEQLTPEQIRTTGLVESALVKREEFYDDVNEPLTIDQQTSDTNSEPSDMDCDNGREDISQPFAPQIPPTNIDWRLFIMIKGKPGTGKSFALLHIIKRVLQSDYRVLCATPTGMLASNYTAAITHDQFVANTVHSSFRYPVDKNERPTINWEITNFDLVVVDELSMVPQNIFAHIVDTIRQLHVRPVLLLCGDPQQQQPFDTVSGKSVIVPNVLHNKQLDKNSTVVHFVTQHRCQDPEFQELLHHIRHYRPSTRVLRALHGDRILYFNKPTDHDIFKVLTDMSDAIMLTVSRNAANRVNRIAANNLFSDKPYFGHIQFDNSDNPQPLYKDMKVIVMQNTDKDLGIVNGRHATVITIQGASVFLKLCTGQMAAIYHVTTEVENTMIVKYPIVPAYASTICKIQGQNLKKIVLWLDWDNIPQGSACVAISRIKYLKDFFFLTPSNPRQYSPEEQLQS